MILTIPDFDVIGEGVYIDEILVLRKNEILHTIKAKISFIQYVHLYDNKIEVNECFPKCFVCEKILIPDEMFPDENNMKCPDSECTSHKINENE